MTGSSPEFARRWNAGSPVVRWIYAWDFLVGVRRLALRE